jgi:hypothetical protein
LKVSKIEHEQNSSNECNNVLQVNSNQSMNNKSKTSTHPRRYNFNGTIEGMHFNFSKNFPASKRSFPICDSKASPFIHSGESSNGM